MDIETSLKHFLATALQKIKHEKRLKEKHNEKNDKLTNGDDIAKVDEEVKMELDSDSNEVDLEFNDLAQSQIIIESMKMCKYCNYKDYNKVV